MAEESKRVNVTLSISEDVRIAFKMETVRNSSEMSTTVENFMKEYVKASQKLHDERALKIKEAYEK